MKKLFVLIASLQCSLHLMASYTPDFMVISDMRVMATSIFNTGTAFITYSHSEQTVAEYSQLLMEDAVSRVESVNPKFLLVSGDLTQNGEKASHEYVANRFAQLERRGVNVYVIPGDHDIANPDAKSYLDANTATIDNISADDFKTLYNDYGYSEAQMTNGLSYMVYPADGLALICIDSSKDNTTTLNSEGGISEELMQWIEKAALTARQDGRLIIGMMHHPVMEHFDGQATFLPAYVSNQSDGYPGLSTIQERLVKAGINMMFTGHMHAQSISKTTTSEGDLYDVSTGSLCQYPSPIRSGSIASDGTVSLNSQLISTYQSEEELRTRYTASDWLSQMKLSDYSDKLLEPMTDVVKCFMAGDENEQSQANVKVTAVTTAAAATGLSTMQQIAIGSMAQSIMANYVGAESNVQADNTNSVVLVYKEATGISNISGNAENPSATYTIDGRRVNTPATPGLYITNGRKVLVK